MTDLKKKMTYRNLAQNSLILRANFQNLAQNS